MRFLLRIIPRGSGAEGHRRGPLYEPFNVLIDIARLVDATTFLLLKIGRFWPQSIYSNPEPLAVLSPRNPIERKHRSDCSSNPRGLPVQHTTHCFVDSSSSLRLERSTSVSTGQSGPIVSLIMSTQSRGDQDRLSERKLVGFAEHTTNFETGSIAPLRIRRHRSPKLATWGSSKGSASKESSRAATSTRSRASRERSESPRRRAGSVCSERVSSVPGEQKSKAELRGSRPVAQTAASKAPDPRARPRSTSRHQKPVVGAAEPQNPPPSPRPSPKISSPVPHASRLGSATAHPQGSATTPTGGQKASASPASVPDPDARASSTVAKPPGRATTRAGSQKASSSPAPIPSHSTAKPRARAPTPTDTPRADPGPAPVPDRRPSSVETKSPGAPTATRRASPSPAPAPNPTSSSDTTTASGRAPTPTDTQTSENPQKASPSPAPAAKPRPTSATADPPGRATTPTDTQTASPPRAVPNPVPAPNPQPDPTPHIPKPPPPPPKDTADARSRDNAAPSRAAHRAIPVPILGPQYTRSSYTIVWTRRPTTGALPSCCRARQQQTTCTRTVSVRVSEVEHRRRLKREERWFLVRVRR